MAITSTKTKPGDSAYHSPHDLELTPTFALKPQHRDDGVELSDTPAPAKSPAPQSKLATIEGYEVLSELGRGGMAIVFKARQLALNRMVALKMVLGGDFREPEFHIRFQMEAEAVARLQHPNIIQIFDFSTISGMFPGETRCPYIAFEYVAGGSLSNRIGGLPQPAHEAARIVEVLADAVQYAHRCGIIHRDLKPSNVLLTADGMPKISDFGLAKLLDEGDAAQGLTAAGTVLGTPEYMAPEQASPGRRVSHSVDIYALGVILYEALTGRPPFAGGTPLETVRQVCSRDPIRPRTLQPNVPRDLETICLKCLRKEPRQRYTTAMALADDLRRFQSGQPIVARPVGPLERGWKWARRHHSLAALLLFTMALVIFGLPGVTYLWITADQAKLEAVSKARAADNSKREAMQSLDAAVRAGNEARRLRIESEHREARLALEQGLSLCQQGQIDRGLLWLTRSLELYAPFKDADVERALRVNLADWSQQVAGPVLALEPFPGRTTGALFLPGGKAIVSTDYFVRLFDLATGKPISEPVGGPYLESVTDPFTMVLSLALSPDGKTVAMGRTNGVVHFYDVATQKQVGRVLRHNRNVWSLAYSPEGDTLAATHDNEVVVWRLATGEQLLKNDHKATIGQVAFDPSGKTLVTAAWDGKMRLFDAASGQLTRELTVQRDRLGALALSAAGDYLAVGGRDGKSQVYTFPELDEVGVPLRHLAGVTAAVFTPNGQIVVTGGRDEAARIWETATGRPLAPPIRFSFEVSSVDISADGRRCLIGGNNGQTLIWELPLSRQIGKSMAHPWAIEALAFTPDGSKLVVGCANAAYVWDPRTSVKKHTFSANNTRLRSVALSPDGQDIIAAPWDETLWRWSAQGDGFAEPNIVPIPASASVIACAASGQVWQTNPPRRLKLSSVDLATGKPGPHSFVHQSAILCLAIKPDETIAATGSSDSKVRLWDVHNDQVLFTLVHPDRVQTLCFSSDGTRLATGCRDGVARIWDVASGKLLTATSPQQSPVMSVAFSADGGLLATGGGDHSACFWDTATGIILGAPLWHVDAVQAVAFDPANQYLATGCRDGNVRLWKLPASPIVGDVNELRTQVGRLTDLRLPEDGGLQRGQ